MVLLNMLVAILMEAYGVVKDDAKNADSLLPGCGRVAELLECHAAGRCFFQSRSQVAFGVLQPLAGQTLISRTRQECNGLPWHD